MADPLVLNLGYFQILILSTVMGLKSMEGVNERPLLKVTHVNFIYHSETSHISKLAWVMGPVANQADATAIMPPC